MESNREKDNYTVMRHFEFSARKIAKAVGKEKRALSHQGSEQERMIGKKSPLLWELVSRTEVYVMWCRWNVLYKKWDFKKGSY